MLVQDHGVGVAVELLETEAGVVLPLDLLDGLLEQVPDVLHVLLVHGGGEGADAHLALLLGHRGLHLGRGLGGKAGSITELEGGSHKRNPTENLGSESASAHILPIWGPVLL